MSDPVSIVIDGRALQVPAGTSAAAAIMLGSPMGFKLSVTGEQRGPLCGMGICFECTAMVDGRPGCRTCQLPVHEGMVIRTAC